MMTRTAFVAMQGVIIGRKTVPPILSPDSSQFPRVLDDNAAAPQSIPCRPAWEMYRFHAQIVPFGDKEWDWRTG